MIDLMCDFLALLGMASGFALIIFGAYKENYFEGD